MDRLLAYLAHHALLGSTTLAIGLALAVYELRERAHAQGAVSPQDAVRLMNQGATLLDVRDAGAYAAGHIRGARHLPPDQLASAGEALKRFREKPVIVYCERGVSAAGAVRELARQGFTRVVNLRGGLAAWRGEQLPLARD
jgi:rhodanese-related sulfurtransferase